MPDAHPTRHFGMDWLRIAAFGLLILYHVGMVFVPWDFHINAQPAVEWLVLPMLAINPWRLTLLFVVSGYASRKLFARSSGPGAFLQERSWRLLLPLLFGVAVVVPPQAWVELSVKHGYPHGVGWFWAHDYFAFAPRDGIFLPTWNHLWFVGYLWTYTLALALAAPIVRHWPLQAWFDRLFSGAGVLWLPTVWLACVHGWWFSMAYETHRFVDDGVAHAIYVPAFLFGFGLAGSERAMGAIAARWRPAAVLAVVGYAAIVYVEAFWPGEAPAPRWTYRPYGVAHALQQWGTILVLIALAERRWNRDTLARATLTEAIFPLYLIHQTIIVLAGYWLLPLDLGALASFLAIAAMTVAGCWAFYLAGRESGPFRPLIGLARHRRSAPAPDQSWVSPL